jgi:gag-polypeptide of LTR copia-type
LVSVQYQQLLSKILENAKHQNKEDQYQQVVQGKSSCICSIPTTAQQNTRKKTKYQNKANHYQQTEK